MYSNAPQDPLVVHHSLSFSCTASRDVCNIIVYLGVSSAYKMCILCMVNISSSLFVDVFIFEDDVQCSYILCTYSYFIYETDASCNVYYLFKITVHMLPLMNGTRICILIKMC